MQRFIIVTSVECSLNQGITLRQCEARWKTVAIFFHCCTQKVGDYAVYDPMFYWSTIRLDET